MIDGFHTGKGAFLKNWLASRPEQPSTMARHPSVLEEPEPVLDLASSMRHFECSAELDLSGPEFDFEELH